MKKTIYLAISLAFVTAAHGATGFFDGFYFVTSFNGGGNVFNQITSGTTPGSGAAAGHNLTPDGSNPAFSDFGTIALADTLVVKGFEYKTFQNDSSDVTHGNLYYRVFTTGSPSGTFTQVQDATDPGGGGNKTWQELGGTTDITSGLGAGDYTIEVYTESFTNGTNTAGNIFGFSSNPTATFTIAAVPEPSSAALLGLGGLALILRRRK